MLKFIGKLLGGFVGNIPALLIFRSIGWSPEQVLTVYKVFAVSGLIWLGALLVFLLCGTLLMAASR